MASHTVIRKALPHSGTTIRNWILDHFLQTKLIVKKNLEGTKIVHFTFDLWTSPNHRAFLGVVGHWVDECGSLHGVLLGLRRFIGSHSGANQASHFWEVVKDFAITHHIGYFTLDNASNNDTALEEISLRLSYLNISFNPVKHRLRCFGHVINLVVKAFLWGNDAEAFEYELAGYEVDQQMEEVRQWRKRGPMGKLHNICVWICRTPQRRDSFEEKVHQQLRHLLRLSKG